MMGSNLAELFAPGVALYVEALLVEGRVGICSGTLRIIDIGSRSVALLALQLGLRPVTELDLG